MNERIEQMADECREYIEGTLDGDIVEFNYKKFAELLIKDAGNYLMSPEFIGRSDLDWSVILNELFGIEE